MDRAAAEPRQRLCSGAPHIVVMAGKPTRAARARTGYPHLGLTNRNGKDRVLRRLMVLASTALITGALAGCGNTDSWVDAHAAAGWPAQYGDAANSSYTGLAGANALKLDWTRSVKGELGAAVALGSRRLPGGQRPDRGRLLADGVGERQQRPPTLVHPAGAGRRVRPARCSTGSTTSTSASPARCCRSRRRSGSAGASR